MSTFFGLSWRKKRPEAKVPDAAAVAAAAATPPEALYDRVLKHMPGALVVANADGLVEGAFAQASLLLGEHLEGQPLHEVLGVPDDGAAGLMQLWIASVVGQDAGAWDIYLDQAPRRSKKVGPDGQERELGIDVSPLMKDGVVDRILLQVRHRQAGDDVAVSDEAQSQASAEQMELFACEATGIVADCQSAFERIVADPAARHAVHHLFRSLHTLKGTARTFGIASVQDVTHEAEDYLATLRASAEPVDPEKLAAIDAHLTKVRQAVSATTSGGGARKQAAEVRFRDEIDRLIDALDDVAERMSEEALDELGARSERVHIDELHTALMNARNRRDAGSRAHLGQLARQLRPLVRELRDCPLPQHFLAEVERCLEAARDAADLAARGTALNALTACAQSLGVDSVRSIARRAAQDHASGSPIADALDELSRLLVIGKALSPRLLPRVRVDVLGLFHEEARRLLSQMERALGEWQANPRGPTAMKAVQTLSDLVALYRACARRFQLPALTEQVQDVDDMLQEARKSERPQRSLAARVEQWIAELDAHLRLYQTFQVELRATGERSQELLRTLAAAAARVASGGEEKTAALATIAALTYEAGLLSVSAALAEQTPAAESRVLRLCGDAVGLTVEPVAPVATPKSQEPSRTEAVAAAARAYEATLASGDPGQLRAAWNVLRRAIDGLGRLPVASLASKVGLTVAEAARDTGKDVGLEVDDDDVEADEGVLRRLSEVLLHAARNAVDHGIETPEARVQAGKPPMGIIALKARLVGRKLRIELRDDGKGVDLARVRAKAVSSGRLAADCAINDVDLLDLLFEPGFSTAEEVTQLSGRGVGMDAVRSIAQELGGSAWLESTPGKGTRLIVELPAGVREGAANDGAPTLVEAKAS